MTRTVRRWTGALSAAVTIAALAGCGGGSDEEPAAEESSSSAEESETTSSFAADSTPPEIRDAAIAAMKQAKSMRIDGNVTAEAGEVDLDLSADREGNCTGTISVGGASPAEILGAGGKSYVRGDEAFWSGITGNETQGQAIARQIGDKWALLPGEGFTSLCDLDELLDQLDEDADEQLTKGEVSDVEGTEAVALTSEEEGETTTTYVATGEPHYILRVEKVGGTEPGAFTLTEFGESVDAAPPAEDEIIDLSALAG